MRMVAALQVNEAGQPVLDLAHVIECLNKLEVGSAEKVLLVRTNQNPHPNPHPCMPPHLISSSSSSSTVLCSSLHSIPQLAAIDCHLQWPGSDLTWCDVVWCGVALLCCFRAGCCLGSLIRTVVVVVVVTPSLVGSYCRHRVTTSR